MSSRRAGYVIVLDGFLQCVAKYGEASNGNPDSWSNPALAAGMVEWVAPNRTSQTPDIPSRASTPHRAATGSHSCRPR